MERGGQPKISGRKGGIPPIALVMLAFGLLVSAVIVAWFTLSAARVAQGPRLAVQEAYARCTVTSCTITVLVKNLSAERVSILGVTLHVAAGSAAGSCSPSTVEVGGTASCSFTTSPVNDGESATLTLTVAVGGVQHTLALPLRIIRP
ncbi:MAG: hypothetical protein QXL64_06130 [Thermofilaceae archaeon]